MLTILTGESLVYKKSSIIIALFLSSLSIIQLSSPSSASTGRVSGNDQPDPRPEYLQGFSVHADREQMSSLPEQFLLGGALEAAACYIAYPDVLARDGNTPLLDLAAMQWQSADYSLYFYAGDGYASFDHGTTLDGAAGDCAGGLVVLG